MSIDVQVDQHSSTGHVQGFSHSKGKQMVVTSLGDVTTMVLTLQVGSYIKRACMSLWALIWAFGCSTSGSNWLGATDQRVCLAATLVPLEEWNYNQRGKCSLFVQP